MHPWTESSVPCLICVCSNLFIKQRFSAAFIRTSVWSEMLMTTIAKRQQWLICLTNRPAMAQRWAFTSTSGRKLRLVLEANKIQQRKKSTKTHANAAHVNQSIKHELRPALVNPYTSCCLNAIQQKRCRVFNFSDKYSPWKISRLYFLLSLYLFF